MILTHLMGGLGNQMFQYAFGKALAESNNTDHQLDLTSLERDTQRQFQLDGLNITSKVATHDTIQHYTQRPWLFKILEKAKLRNPTQVIEKNADWFQYYPRYLTKSKTLFLKGYWQAHQYMAFANAVVQKEFTFKHPPSSEFETYLKTASSTASVSLHIRRGDYVNHSLFNSLHGEEGDAYYKKSINFIAEKVIDPHFFIFSDDPEWVQTHFKLHDNKITYINQTDPKKAYEDLRLMSTCQHNIIANSSFSWWGAYLNRNSHKIVVAPHRWINSPLPTQDLIPPTWKRF